MSANKGRWRNRWLRHGWRCCSRRTVRWGLLHVKEIMESFSSRFRKVLLKGRGEVCPIFSARRLRDMLYSHIFFCRYHGTFPLVISERLIRSNIHFVISCLRLSPWWGHRDAVWSRWLYRDVVAVNAILQNPCDEQTFYFLLSFFLSG
jgi:hypothetical protein